jgi:hypothetical protein
MSFASTKQKCAHYIDSGKILEIDCLPLVTDAMHHIHSCAPSAA